MKKTLMSLRSHLAVAALLLGTALWPMLHLYSVHAQANCTPPPTEQSNGKNAYWAKNTVVKVWIGPGFTTAEVNDIKSGIQNWAQTPGLSSNNITFQYITGNDPALSNGLPPANTIRVYNDPSASPNKIAYTTPTYFQDSTGTNTNQLAGANIAFNKGFKYNGANGPTPQYDATLPNADTFFTSVSMHEMGHAIGLGDASAPTDPNTGQPNTCLQTAGATIMNGACGTNDRGDGTAPGGKLPTSLTQCDKDTQSSSETAGNPSGSTGGGGDTGGGSGDVCDLDCGWGDPFDLIALESGCTYEDWNEETLTLTCY